MKHNATIFLGLCSLLIGFNSIAQSGTTKPSAFNSFPKITYCSTVAIANLFAIPQGQTAKIQFGDNHLFEGKIINKISKYNNTLQTIVLQIPAFGNSILSISKRTEQDKIEVFIGHLYNDSFADGFQLKPGKNNQYELVKITTDQVLQPCNQ